MTLYGIFDKNKNYKLLRYSNIEQGEVVVQDFDITTKTFFDVHEICFPNIEYLTENIGKYYNPSTNSFSETPTI